jgi:dipeptidyl aminopeptidase/acylaminoacyl peptidase
MIASKVDAPWRRRFLAPTVSFPVWAREKPDRLVYTSNASGKREVYAWDQSTGRQQRVTDRPEGTMIAGLDPQGGRIWWFDDDHGNEFGRWKVEDFPSATGGSAAETLPLAPAYPAGLVLGVDFAVIGSANVDGVRVHLVRHGLAPRELYRHSHDASVHGPSRDERLLCLSHSEHGDSRHPALRVIDLEGSTVAELWDGPGHGLEAGDWSPLRGDQRMIVTHERGDLPRPLIWDPSAGSVRELAIDLPGEVRASWFPDARALLLVHHHRGRDELYRLDLESGRLTPIPGEKGTIQRAAVRPDGEVWTAWSSSSTPPRIRTEARVVLEADERAPAGVAYRSHEVGGVPVFVAAPASPSPHPTIFIVHGGPTAHDGDAFSPRVQAWVDHGYAAVLVNYRGSTGYGRAWRDALEGNPGLTELEDIAAVHDWAIASGLADPGRVVLSGNSWGGYLTLLGLGTQPERWSLGIAGVPVADYVAAYEDEMEPLQAFDRSLFGGSPEEAPEVYRRTSPITYVDRVRVPVLVLAGANDPRCPIRQIENYLARMRELGKAHEVYRFDAGHGSLRIEETIKQVEMELAFAARHLGTPAPL